MKTLTVAERGSVQLNFRVEIEVKEVKRVEDVGWSTVRGLKDRVFIDNVSHGRKENRIIFNLNSEVNLLILKTSVRE